MVDAQRARRVLDRLVGYKISPLLWDKVRRGLSAGRVQSVALKLVCDREREIEQFVPEEYWNLFARLAGPQPPEFEAKLLKKDGETHPRRRTRRQSNAILADLERRVVDRHVGRRPRSASATRRRRSSRASCSRRRAFPVKKTMMLAQQLYEGHRAARPARGPVGLITYMRTDSIRVADEALVGGPRAHQARVRRRITCPRSRTSIKTKADAQDAHEAIRPTSMQYDPETVRPYLTPDQYSLYRLIWNRFVASQMPPATFDETTVDVDARPSTCSA